MWKISFAIDRAREYHEVWQTKDEALRRALDVAQSGLDVADNKTHITIYPPHRVTLITLRSSNVEEK